jgi:hypothetical protein
VGASNGGIYRVSAYIIVTQAATTSSTLPQVNIIFTDADNSTSQTLVLTPTNTGNVLTTFENSTNVINAKLSTNVNYSTTGLTTVGATALNYALHLRIEAV